MGRKKKPGARSDKTGRLLQAKDYGNDRVQARAACFRHFRGDSGTGFEMTCAGRLMLVGCFDGMEVPAETVLATLLTYSDGYWRHFGGGADISQFERSDRSRDNRTASTPDPEGEWFDAMDLRLRNAGHLARTAVHDCTVNRHWFPDENCWWADAVINRRMLDKKAELMRAGKPVPPLIVNGEIATDGHEAWGYIELLRAGAAALMEPAKVRRAA